MKQRMFALLCCVLLLPAGLALANEESQTLGQWLDSATNSVSDWMRESGELEARGTATIAAAPDTATLRIGITGEDKDQLAAQQQADSAAAAITDALAALGMAQGDISTVSNSVTQIKAERSVLGGSSNTYRAGITLRVTVTDFTKIQPALEAALEAGASSIGDTVYSHSKEGELYRQALREAIASARAKAEDMADAAGVSLHTLLHLREEQHTGAYTNSYTGKEDGNPTSQLVPADLEFTASVTIVYQVK